MLSQGDARFSFELYVYVVLVSAFFEGLSEKVEVYTYRIVNVKSISNIYKREIERKITDNDSPCDIRRNSVDFFHHCFRPIKSINFHGS